MLKCSLMFKRACFLFAWAVVLPLAAQLSSALPADRLAFANQLAKRGLHAEALKEYEAIREVKTLPRDNDMGTGPGGVSANFHELHESLRNS